MLPTETNNAPSAHSVDDNALAQATPQETSQSITGYFELAKLNLY